MEGFKDSSERGRRYGTVPGRYLTLEEVCEDTTLVIETAEDTSGGESKDPGKDKIREKIQIRIKIRIKEHRALERDMNQKKRHR